MKITKVFSIVDIFITKVKRHIFSDFLLHTFRHLCHVTVWRSTLACLETTLSLDRSGVQFRTGFFISCVYVACVGNIEIGYPSTCKLPVTGLIYLFILWLGGGRLWSAPLVLKTSVAGVYQPWISCWRLKGFTTGDVGCVLVGHFRLRLVYPVDRRSNRWRSKDTVVGVQSSVDLGGGGKGEERGRLWYFPKDKGMKENSEVVGVHYYRRWEQDLSGLIGDEEE